MLVCLGVWLHAADALVATTVMPSAIGDIGGLAFVYWTLALYELGSIVAGATTGLLAVRLGLRGAMSSAAAVYVAGCVASALAPNMNVMLAGRLVQGLGGGAMLALSYVGVSLLFPAPQWPRVLAIVSSAWGVSALIGPVVGGAFASIGMWRGAFWAFAVQGLVLIAASPVLVPAHTSLPADTGGLPTRQLAGLTGAVLAVSAAGNQGDPARMLGLGALGLAGLAWVVRADATATVRLFPRRPLDLRTTAGAGFAMVLALATATVAFTVYGPLLLARLFGVTPFVAGFLVAVESVAWTLAAIAFANAPPARESVLIRTGAVCVALGVVALAVVMPHGPVWLLAPCVGIQGMGFGMGWAFLLRRIVAAVADDDRERASAALPTMQMIGYAVGAAASGMLANALGLADGAPDGVVRRVAFWLFAAFVPLAAGGVGAAWRVARR